MHSGSLIGDTFASTLHEGGRNLRESLRMIERAGCGVVVYLPPGGDIALFEIGAISLSGLRHAIGDPGFDLRRISRQVAASGVHKPDLRAQVATRARQRFGRQGGWGDSGLRQCTIKLLHRALGGWNRCLSRLFVRLMPCFLKRSGPRRWIISTLTV